MEEWDGRGFGAKKGKSLREIKREYPMDRVLRMLSGERVDVGHAASGWRSIKCPLHVDNNPSASINLDAGRYRCHSCGVGGDIFDVVAQTLGLQTVREAKAWIISNG